MTRDQFLDDQYRISFIAGMNQRYHQQMAMHWGRWDRGMKVATGILTVAGAVLSVVTYVVTGWDSWSIGVAISAAGLAVALNVIPLGDWQRDAVDLFRRWTDLREEIDALPFELSGKLDDHLVSRLRALDGKLHRICGTEPAARLHVLRACEEAERCSRGETPLPRVA